MLNLIEIRAFFFLFLIAWFISSKYFSAFSLLYAHTPPVTKIILSAFIFSILFNNASFSKKGSPPPDICKYPTFALLANSINLLTPSGVN